LAVVIHNILYPVVSLTRSNRTVFVHEQKRRDENKNTAPYACKGSAEMDEHCNEAASKAQTRATSHMGNLNGRSNRRK